MNTEIVTVAGQQYHKADWPRRILARLVDGMLVFVAWGIFGGWLLLFAVPLGLAYLLMGNALCGGRSLGNRMAGLKVIDAVHGGPCSAIQELVRHRYILFYNPLFVLLTAYDTTQGCFDKPELYVVRDGPLTLEEQEELREKPAHLNLAGLRDTLQKLREPNSESDRRS